MKQIIEIFLILCCLFILSLERKHKCVHNQLKRTNHKRLDQPRPEPRGRKLQGQKQNIRVTFDYSSLETVPLEYDYVKNEIIEQLDLASKFFGEMLKVERLTYNNYFPDWGYEHKCVDVFPHQDDIQYGVPNSDLHIYVHHYHDPKDGVLAYADSCHWTDVNRPLFGGITFNTGVFEASEKHRHDQFEDNFETILHEIIHVLGFSDGMWEYFINPATGLAYGKDNKPVIVQTIRGKKSNILTTPKITKLAREHFGCDSLQGIQMENEGGDGSAGSHFERVILENEYMTASAISHDASLTAFTIAVLEDSGWYESTGMKIDEIDWGKGQGCNFLTSCDANNFREFDSSQTQCSFYHSGVGTAKPEYDDFNDNCNITYIYRDSLCLDTDNIRKNDDIYGNVYGQNNRCFYSNIFDSSQGTTTQSERCLPWVCNKDGTEISVIVAGEKYPLDKVTNKVDVSAKGSNQRLEGYVKGPEDWNAFCNTYPLTCPNFCSSHGYCLGRQCHCGLDYAGSDCNTKCENNGYIYKGKCLNSQECPDGTTLNWPSKECLPNENSASCNPGDFKFNQECVSSCPAGYFREGDSCQACNYSCQSCTTYQFCETCKDGFYLYDNNGLKQCVNKCPKYYYPNKNQECINQAICHKSCKYCAVQNECSLCSEGEYLNENKLCSTCMSVCKTCENSNTCVTCEANLFFYQSKCLGKCPLGYVANQKNVCEACATEFCAQCSAVNSCYECYTGYYLEISNQTCVKCSQNCFNCTSKENCLTCASGSERVTNGDGKVVCALKCLEGYFLSGDNTTCNKCPNNCLQCTSSQVCTKCQENTFFDQKQGICHLCNRHCKTCSDTNACLSCEDELLELNIMGNLSCVQECPTNYKKKKNECKKTSNSGSPILLAAFNILIIFIFIII